MKQVALLFGLMCILSANVRAQVDQFPGDRSPADHITALASGTLLIRLPSDRKKIQAIEASLENDNLSDNTRSRLIKLAATTKEETEELHNNYIAALKEEYSFSDYGFFYDYDTPAILEGWGKVLQDDLTTRKDVEWDESWYILSIGKTPGSRLDGLVILDRNLNPVPRPFPNNVLTSGIPALFAWFSSDPVEYLFVRKLQRNLERFLERN